MDICILIILQPTACSGDPNGPQQADTQSQWGGESSYILYYEDLPVLTKFVCLGYCYHGCLYLVPRFFKVR